MSLFGKKNLFEVLEKSGGDLSKLDSTQEGSSSKRKKPQKPKPRRFQIADSDQEIEPPVLELGKKSEETRARVEQALSSSKLATLTPDGPIEPTPRLGKRKLKAAKKHAKSLTKGSKWFNMAKAEITKEKKNDLEVLKLRSAMEGIHHYKRNHMTHTPKYFHVGTIVETSADFYSSRLTKKQRKKTLAEEFAADYGV